MNQPLLLELPAWLVSLFIFIIILVFIWLGSAFRNYETKRGKEIPPGPLSPVENSMLSLMALMIAFTFGMALTKFEARRRGIVDEANAIEAAIMRCDLYPDSARALLRADLKQYINTRIAFNEAGANPEKIRTALDEAAVAYSTIWKRVVGLSRTQSNFLPTNQMTPTITSVVNIATSREAERLAKVPPLVLLILVTLILIGSFLIGFNQTAAKRSKIFTIGFAFTTTLAVYLILELERPWTGVMNLKATEQRIVKLRSMLE